MIPALPLFVPLLAKLFFRPSLSFECQAFSEALWGLSRWLKFLTILSAGVKVEDFVGWDWYLALWPIWIGSGILVIISTAVLLLCGNMMIDNLLNNRGLRHMIHPLWLLYTCASFTWLYCFFFHSLAAYLEGDPSSLDLAIGFSLVNCLLFVAWTKLSIDSLG